MVVKECPRCGSRHYKASRLLKHYIKEHDGSQEGVKAFAQWIYKTYFPEEYSPRDDIEAARIHHIEHGDMDGHTCLLAECALHYPKVRSLHRKVRNDSCGTT